METKEYEKQGTDFLEKHNVKMTVKFLYNGPYFEDEKESRDIYNVTLERAGKRPYSFRFGQSINHSKTEARPYESFTERKTRLAKIKAPTAYDVLAALTKYDPGSFENFCGDFGYNTDSRKAEKTYMAVMSEYHSLKAMFTDAELDEMSEIS